LFVRRYLPETRVCASLCFTRYLNLNPRTPRKLDVTSLKAKIMTDFDAWRQDPTLRSIRRTMNGLSDEDTESRYNSKAMQTLMMYAMGVEREHIATLKDGMQSPNSYAWSFCKDKWVSRHRTVHCKHCDVCYDLAWHCEVCGTCKAGRTLACDGC
jgi:hypothetical protein